MTARTDASQAIAKPGVLRTIRSYARLVKFQFVLDFYLAPIIAWTALAPLLKTDGDTLVTLLFFALGQAGVLFAVMTLDDVTGIKDGSDHANYVAANKSQLRPLKRKPLLTGELTVAQAQRYGYLSLVWGAAWWLAAVLHTDHQQGWILVVTGLLLTLSVQYSWGLKLSYYGLGELVLLFSAAAFLIAPYGLATGELPALVLVEGLLFGFGQLMIAGYSNTNDIDGDKAAGRRTVAVMTSGTRYGNVVFLGLLTTANILVILVPAFAGWVPWWLPFALLPAIVLRLRQYAGFVRNQGAPLVARIRGVLVFRTTVVCVLAVNILYIGF
ncbi:UbiA family prenyltransferase [Kibdelosporangium phytohabitans]|uniref:Prenyltransferase n=1 Tax=Kibdelosporangium phytohabitans TaxID=860235 RepID=A0A0N9I3J1_9PSEU|nr:UbiA family prenyltransferase [Kibdelosporangium phytohabitans]ALG09333.1 prenyltransferase [Kibdelosporangium phytohabitans]MBE1469404.1 1,4-dihydroxy-2-naphthoate octaprenyltransferase [Kibdelosporangium phytohabitans]